jgi:hypothetical protein
LASWIGRAVCSQSDRGTIAGSEHANHTGLANVAMNLAAKLGKLAGDEVGCSVLLETEFGVFMEVSAPSGHLAVKPFDEMWDQHGEQLHGMLKFSVNSRISCMTAKAAAPLDQKHFYKCSASH